MNFKNLLKEQLLSEIILPKREFNPNLLSPKMKLKMGGRKGPDGNIISALKNLKFQPSKENSMIEIKKRLEQEMRDTTPGSLLPKRNKREMSDRPRLTSTELEKYANPTRDGRGHYGKIRDMIDRWNRGEFNQSDLGAQPLKPYKKKFDLSLGFRKQNPDRTIY